ncbi:hypothetical protein Tco_0156651 [Tanacetum coccineum]
MMKGKAIMEESANPKKLIKELKCSFSRMRISVKIEKKKEPDFNAEQKQELAKEEDERLNLEASMNNAKTTGMKDNILNSVSIVVSSASIIVSTGRRFIIVSTGSNSASQNLAFLSSENTGSTNEVSTASGDFEVSTASRDFGVSTAGGINQVPSTPCAYDKLTHPFTTNIQSSTENEGFSAD